MKKLQKMLCILLSLVVVLSLITGCRKKEPEAPPTTEETVEPTTEPIIYRIVYMTNGGILPYDADTDFTLEDPAELAIPIKQNYNFIGWFEEEDFSGYLYTDTVGETGDKIYYAKWSPIEYKITYKLNGGKLEGDLVNPSTYSMESDDITLHNPVKEGYVFDGWIELTEKDGDKELTTDGTIAVPKETVIIPSGSSGDKTFAANWLVQDKTEETKPKTTGGSGAASEHTHTYTNAKVVEATCFNEAYIVKKCSCGHQYKEIVGPALKHDWSDWILVKEENEDEKGIEKRSCRICKVVDSRFIDEIVSGSDAKKNTN